MTCDGQTCREIYRTPDTMLLNGYARSDSAVWVYEISKQILKRVVRGQEEVVKDVFDQPWEVTEINVEPSEEVWVSTRHGAARTTSRLWQPPPAVSGLHQPIYSICEDPAGQLWSIAQEYLVRLRGDEVSLYPLPSRFTAPPTNPPTFPTLGNLPDGQLAIDGYSTQTIWGAQEMYLWMWSPERERWNETRNRIRVHGITPGMKGQVLLRTPDNLIKEFDGKQIRSRIELGGIADLNQPECFYEMGNGDLWVGVGDELRLV